MGHVDDLTPIAQDYLKVIWSAIEWGDPPITTKGLAARFATTQANVSETVRRLDGKGLVNYQPYRLGTVPQTVAERRIVEQCGIGTHHNAGFFAPPFVYQPVGEIIADQQP